MRKFFKIKIWRFRFQVSFLHQKHLGEPMMTSLSTFFSYDHGRTREL